jgi:hypothetical protein
VYEAFGFSASAALKCDQAVLEAHLGESSEDDEGAQEPQARPVVRGGRQPRRVPH